MPTRSRICLPRCCRQQRVRISVREQDPRCPGAYTVGHVPGDLLDLILIVLIIAFGVAGYRQGFIIGILSFVGFIGGGAIGVTFPPPVARSVTGKPAWPAGGPPGAGFPAGLGRPPDPPPGRRAVAAPGGPPAGARGGPPRGGAG